LPKFLQQPEIYDLLQRELPADVYPYGPPSAFFSTADNASIAHIAATGYANLERIYDNYFPLSADERIQDWFITVFNRASDDLTDLAALRDRIVAKLRTRQGFSKPDIINYVYQIIGTDKDIEVVEWGCNDGGWIIGDSQLSISTILNGARQLDVTGPTICEADPSDYGKTPQEWAIMKEEAYTYEVRVYSYTLSSAEYDQLDQLLKENEPARSQHFIYSGLDPADKVSGDT
jgi:hypothetical protein